MRKGGTREKRRRPECSEDERNSWRISSRGENSTSKEKKRPKSKIERALKKRSGKTRPGVEAPKEKSLVIVRISLFKGTFNKQGLSAAIRVGNPATGGEHEGPIKDERDGRVQSRGFCQTEGGVSKGQKKKGNSRRCLQKNTGEGPPGGLRMW